MTNGVFLFLVGTKTGERLRKAGLKVFFYKKFVI